MASVQVWRQSAFRRLWIGQTCTQLASQMSFLVVPLVAAITLNASPMQMGVLTAVSSVPSLVFGLQAGVVVDRNRRRPIMVGADLVRLTLLLAIPVAWWFDILSIPLLCAVVMLTGAASLMFDLAYGAFLPTIVAPDHLVRANSRLELSRSSAELVGPGLGGVVLQVVSAPVALLLNSGLHGLSAVAIAGIRVAEQVPVGTPGEGGAVRRQIAEGMRLVWRQPVLRAMMGARGILSFFNAMLEAVFVLYIVRVLDVSPFMLGVAFGVGGLGFLVGALLPERVNDRFGVGMATVMAAGVIALSDLLVPLAEGTGVLVVPMLIAAQFCFGLGMTVLGVNTVTFRQVLTPAHMQGRTAAIARYLVVGVIPVGALVGGGLGEVLGLRNVLVLAALGELLAAFWIWRSPLRAMRQVGQDSDLTAREVA